jgi:phosphatidylglycerol---prolipoprotein diacylglyceryl transferase
MRQVLFWIPIPNPWFSEGLPVYGFGLMLFLTFVTCTWLASRRAVKEGIKPQFIQDLAIWIFVGGILGARIAYVVQPQNKVPIEQFFKIWEGGLVFYGAAVGGIIGYALAYYVIIRKHGLNTRQIADIVAPTVAWGLMLGRLGCLFNGCCYGHVSCPEPNCSILHFPPAITFPVHSPPWYSLVGKGYQSGTGFTLQGHGYGEPAVVGVVDPDSPASTAGLQSGDRIVSVNGKDVTTSDDLTTYVLRDWPRGQTEIQLTVQRGDQTIPLQTFSPRTFGLHPTQIYEAISMLLLFLLLNAYYPFRRHYGEVFLLLTICYCVHRFINEMLRNDTDAMFGTGMTLSMNVSIVFFAVAVGLWIWLLRRPADEALVAKPAAA